MRITARPSRGARLVAASAIALLTLASCTAPEPPSPSTAAEALLEPRIVASDLDAPWSVAFYGDTPLVSERDSARILELDADGNAREVAVVEGVAPRGEGGLLGIAVRDGYLYAYFTADEENRIERFELRGEAGSLALGEAETVLEGIPAAGNHNGGRIAFGPDGLLYATAGDAGESGNAQDPGSLAGKILRVTATGAVPDDNPFPGSPVYSFGHRNPQGLAWAPDGTLYASEFGQNTWDELNAIRAGGNYGWPEAEGIAGDSGFIDPVQQWAPGDASPSGIAVAGDDLYVANLRGERLRRIPLADPTTSTELAVGRYGRLRDAVVAPDGSLWVLTNNTDGRGDPEPGDDRLLAFDLPR
ncbi:sorbosone dehydrogenase family protein [Leucobacter sp. wl10]|uniref:PQQ-dependent sugar dehydrogenase n=1 Tax=Leucobacter sp. wl10 TaxID=2304677 RepID=UPI000E5A92AC|nr:PQQ-dependent sugar dehydrogenase [Leucobacter sp. wl10]RGE20359.1 PQQ-dependent sugar dehydrogenase [Leucobacter sp. wl10]